MLGWERDGEGLGLVLVMGSVDGGLKWRGGGNFGVYEREGQMEK